ncbi:uncharacterized protein FIBRA_02882 [Fibroporia radiculosa]|uniref:tripeptidyl-peptidase II n=1 Tax=Fibroporia radiculosa TaxID=599839 RepID=J4GN63_9APHY|nr:uncharacterized protein FIBRA_02882 [Fibroporia radiculosa]CCM00840.1 predicted protein [Fibroporia radiculosa]
MHVLGRRDGAPSGYTLDGAASPDTVLRLRLALAPSNPSGLEQALYDVSMPSSTAYKQHLSKADAAQYVSPASDTVSAVNSWLQENNLNATTLTPAGDWLSIQVPVSQANELFDAEFNVYTSQSTGAQTIRTLSYSIPQELVGNLKVVYPTTTFPSTNNLKPVVSIPQRRNDGVNSRADDAASACGSTITPACLQSLYGIPTTPATESTNQLLVTGYGDQWANKEDLELFLQNYRTDMTDTTTFTVQTLDDGSDPQSTDDAGVEADLDTQYTVGIATGVPVIFLSVGDDYHDGDLGGFLDTIDYLLNEDTPPYTMTTSYGGYEPDIPEDLAYNLCNAYAQLGARGVSIMFASGDGGVSGVQSESCTTFVPEFPSGCPYVTSVGGTTGTNPEVAAAFSGGGFSNYWARPSYQDSAVEGYLSYLGDTYAGLYNASGRGFPDVSVQAENFEIYYEQSSTTVSGTSCASPTFASIISLLNDELVVAGDAPLGFLNPWLYSTALSAFTDITSGDNPGCNTNGFSATTGWDPVTGLGTPNYDALKTAAGLTFHLAATPILYRVLDSRIVRKPGRRPIILHPARTLLKKPEYAKYVRYVRETSAVGLIGPEFLQESLAALRLCVNLKGFSWSDDSKDLVDYEELRASFFPILRVLPIKEIVIHTYPGLSEELWSEFIEFTGLQKVAIWTVEGPPRILQGWSEKLGPSLTHLELGRCAGVPASILVSVFLHLPLLQSLRLKGAPATAILEILTFLPNLVQLDTEYLWSGVSRYTDVPIASLRDLTVRTSSVDVQGPRRLWTWIKTLLPRPSLESFTLNAFSTQGDASMPRRFILDLANTQKDTLKYFVADSALLTLEDVQCLCTLFPALEELSCSVAFCQNPSQLEEAIANGHKLRQLRLCTSWVPSRYGSEQVHIPFDAKFAKRIMLRENSLLRLIGIGQVVYTGRWVEAGLPEGPVFEVFRDVVSDS